MTEAVQWAFSSASFLDHRVKLVNTSMDYWSVQRTSAEVATFRSQTIQTGTLNFEFPAVKEAFPGRDSGDLRSAALPLRQTGGRIRYDDG